MKHKLEKGFALIYKISGDNNIPEKGIFFETFATYQEFDNKITSLFMQEANNKGKTIIMFQFPDQETIEKLYK